MANGDAAAAAGMTVVSGTAQVKLGYDEINKSRDYTASFGIKPGTALEVTRGGTGATTAPAAAVALNVVPWTAVAPKGTANAGGVARYSDAGRLQVVSPVALDDVANIRWVEARIAAQPFAELLQEIADLKARVAALERPGHHDG